MLDRRKFISFSVSLGLGCVYPGWLQAARVSPVAAGGYVMTVRGKVNVTDMGITLPHEHLITDFSPATEDWQPPYTQADAFGAMLPHLTALKHGGVHTFVECTPAYIGRNVSLLQQLSASSEINILTNTGYYAAADEKYLPTHAYTESSEQLAARWIKEWKEGIGGTGIRPGFIKLGVGAGPLKPVEQKLIDAAVITHLQTGLKIAIHTGDAAAATDYVNQIAKKVNPRAVIWVHAQNDSSGKAHIELAKKGCFISLDGVNPNAVDKYCFFVKNLKRAGLLSKVLLSHDDGFTAAKQDNKTVFGAYENGNTHPYQSIFKVLKPALLKQGITSKEFDTITRVNPGQAFKIEICPVA